MIIGIVALIFTIALLFAGCYVIDKKELMNSWYGFPCFALWCVAMGGLIVFSLWCLTGGIR